MPRHGEFRLDKRVFADLAQLDGIAAVCLEVAKDGAKIAEQLAADTEKSGDYAHNFRAEEYETKLAGSSLKRKGAMIVNDDPAALRQEFGSAKSNEKPHRHLGRTAARLEAGG